MSDSPLNCDLPETDIEQQLEKPLYRTHGERLASPPARKVPGVSDSSKEMSYGVAFISSRFMDVRTAFSAFRSVQLGIVNLFMITALFVMWIVGQFYLGVFTASAALFVPLWMVIYLFEIFFPLTLPVRIDRQAGIVYVGHRGTYYRIPWDELEVSFSHNLQYLGSGVVWERQYYSHFYLRDKYYLCGKAPKRALQRKKISSGFNEERLYRRWNFIVRYYHDGVVDEDSENLAVINYDSYKEHVKTKPAAILILDYLSVILLMPTMIWWKFSPFKFRWPKEIEREFGTANHY